MSTRTLAAWGAAVVLITFAGVLSADIPLTADADGNVSFRTPSDTVIKVAANGDVSIDGRLLINCREHRGSDIETRLGDVTCYGGYFDVEDSFGNQLYIYPTYADAEDVAGNEYRLPLAKSPVGPVRIDLSEGVKVEVGGQTVTVGEGGEIAVTGPGEVVVADGDYVRVGTGDSAVVVSGDWRSAGTRYRAADTEGILVELGAVEVGDVLRLALAGDVLFDFDSTAIRRDAAEQLAKAAHVIRQRSVGEVYVVGHTDSVGGDDYNRKLSQDRAVAVIGWLHRHEGIPTAIMVGRGMGAEKPVDYNTMPDGSDNPAGRAKNRRVEILLASREGVDVRANVTGAVRVSGQGVDVGGGAVRVDERGVDVGGGAVRVDESGVRVGGVEVSAGGVKVGGVTVGSGGSVTAGEGEGRVVGYETPSACQSGETCNFTCLDGDCRMTCKSDATCKFFCPGGDCEMRCRPGAVCTFGCTGGDCHFDCAEGSRCRTSCLGGECSRS